ncbi:MAG: helix-turn-helix transcriptional regulator, partial [Clostridia bacterium]|nr:helix-turn-helix transcriptional regulator [Clostridia bacterium]
FTFGIRVSSKTPSDFQRHLTIFTDSSQPQILHNQTELIQTWFDLFNDSGLTEPDLLALEILALLSKTARCGFSAIPLPPVTNEPQSSGNITRIAELEYIIDSQFMTRLTREEVAAKLFISKRQLDRICQKRFGKSFHEQITERRLSAAVQMLIETDLTAEEISQQIGFPSKSGFYHDFSRKFGITPYQFRKKQRSLGSRPEN